MEFVHQGLNRRRVWRWGQRALASACLALGFALPASAQPPPGTPWARDLQRALERIDAQDPLELGVYVRDLASGESAAWRTDDTWYLASTVKLPVALAVLTQVQLGALSLDTPVTLRESDRVDGAGSTLRLAIGERRSVGWLLEQMMMYSDNTASDMLIDLVGLRNVNALVQRTVPEGFQPITTLADVRRHLYGQLTPSASILSGQDFLILHARRDDLGRRTVLSHLLNVPVSQFLLPTVADAYQAYYGTGLNSGRLDAYGELLARVASGEVLDPPRTAWLLALMERTKTGKNRIRAGLPSGVRWAHKTGTQFARTCDSGVITVPGGSGRTGVPRAPDRQIVVAACTRHERSLASAESALRQVGAAICRSGLLGADGNSNVDLSCRAKGTGAPPASADRPPVRGGPADGSDAELR